MVSQLQCSQVRHIETVNGFMTWQIFQVQKQYFFATLELFWTMLGTKLGLGPKMKVVTLVKYNFA